MGIFHYEFLRGGFLRLFLNNGKTRFIVLDKNSGRIVHRKVTGSINLQHPGIRLGTDYHTGEVYVLHNHYRYGGAHISTFRDYAAGQTVNWKNSACVNTPLDIIKIGLDNACAGRPYDLLTYNCQTYTNLACNNEYKSDDVEKLVGIGLSVLAIGLIFTALND